MSNKKYGNLLVKLMNICFKIQSQIRFLIPFESCLPVSKGDKNNKGQDLQMQLLDWLEVASI